MKESNLRSRIIEASRSDTFFVIVLLALNTFLAAVFFNTMPFGDTPFYAHMTRVIVENHSIFEPDFFSYFSILLSLVNIPAYLIFRNEFLAIRVTTMIIHVLIAPVFFLLFRRLLRPFGRLLSLVVLVSPWLIYFSCMFSVSEGLTALLAMLSLYFFFRHKRFTAYDYLWFSVFSGLALLARTAYLLFVWPFGLYLLYYIYRDHLKGLKMRNWFGSRARIAQMKFASLFLVIIPFIVWSLIRSRILDGAGGPATNYFTFFVQITTEYAEYVFNPVFLLKSFLVIVLLALPLLFGPFLLFIIYRKPRFRMSRSFVVFLAFVFLVLFHTFWFVGNTMDPLIRLRYFVPYLTIGLVALAMKVKADFRIIAGKTSDRISLFGKRISGTDIVGTVLLITIAFSLLLTIIVNFPFISSSIVSIYPDGYDTITVQSGNTFAAIDWANTNLPEDADVGVFLRERFSFIRMYYFYPDLLRKDITVHIPDTNITFGDYQVLEKGDDVSGFYIISDRPAQDLSAELGTSLDQLYAPGRPPFYVVYKAR